MNAETFLENFAHHLDAPNGISKLRELILQLAVQGKLVEQKTNEEPAATLLQKIDAKKKKLLEGKSIRKIRTLFPPEMNDSDEDLPTGWEIAYLGRISTVLSDGSHNPPPKQLEGIPMLSSQNVLDDSITLDASRYITEEDYLREIIRTPIQENDVFLTIVATIGRSAVVPKDFPRIALQRSVALIRSDLYSRYFSLFLRSLKAFEYYDTNAKGTAQKGLYLGKLSLLPVYIPPLEEQKRIVEKVDELMRLTDKLELEQSKSASVRLAMSKSSFNALTESSSAAEFSKNWQRVSQNFDDLIKTPEDIKTLRQSILRLAVQGKLVDTAGSHTELISSIEAIRDKSLSLNRKAKENTRIEDGFEKVIEEGRANLSEIVFLTTRCVCDFITKGTTPPKTALLTDAEIPFLKVYNIVNNKIDFFYKPIFTTQSSHEGVLQRSKVYPHDVVMNIVGPPLGKVAVIPNDFPEWNINQALAIFRPLQPLNYDFLALVLSCDLTLKAVLKETKGTAGQDNLNLEQCRDIPLPIFAPSIQKRIVAKVDALMAYCDSLEALLLESEGTAEKLAGAVVRELAA